MTRKWIAQDALIEILESRGIEAPIPLIKQMPAYTEACFSKAIREEFQQERAALAATRKELAQAQADLAHYRDALNWLAAEWVARTGQAGPGAEDAWKATGATKEAPHARPAVDLPVLLGYEAGLREGARELAVARKALELACAELRFAMQELYGNAAEIAVPNSRHFLEIAEAEGGKAREA